MDSPVTIYITLLNEGLEVWRPMSAEQVGPDLFLVSGPAPAGEEWAHPPGSLVRCEPRRLFGDNGFRETGFVAMETLDPRAVAN